MVHLYTCILSIISNYMVFPSLAYERIKHTSNHQRKIHTKHQVALKDHISFQIESALFVTREHGNLSSAFNPVDSY